MFVNIPSGIKENEFHFSEETGSLYYKVGEACAYIIVKSLSEEMIPHVISVIKDVNLAINCHFFYLNKIKTTNRQSEKELMEYVLFKGSSNIKEIIKMSNSQIDLDINKPYVIRMSQIDESDHEIDWELIRSYTKEYCKQVNLDAVPIVWQDRLVLIIPIHYDDNTLEVDTKWPRIEYVARWNQVVDAKFNIVTSSSIGQIYTLPELHKSYNEARFALTLPQLFGKKGFVQRFSDLGIFSIIFSQDIEILKRYCLNTLSKLIEYDNENDGELLPTLRKLLDNSVKWKDTADHFFIHINTLQYRINRVEQLLNVDFRNMDVRANLFLTIKIWDTLRLNGFFE